MQQDLNRVIEQVSKEKGIDKAILISALENAMISAAKKTFGHQRKIEAQFNPEIGEVELFEAKAVVESVQDPAVEVNLDEARETLDPDAQLGDELLCKPDSCLHRERRNHQPGSADRFVAYSSGDAHQAF